MSIKKKSLDVLNSRLHIMEDINGKRGERTIELIQSEKTNENTLKRNNIHIIKISELEQNEHGPESLLERVIVDNFPNLTTYKFIDPRF